MSLGIETLPVYNLQVAPARKTEVILQTIEPGYEKPKSGPTTNFVGKTNTCVPFVRICTLHGGAMHRT